MSLFGRPTERDERRAREYARWLQQRNPLAIASLVLGIFSLIEGGVLIVFGVAGIALGVAALVQLRRAERMTRNAPPAIDPRTPIDLPPPIKTRGHRLAWSGIVLSALSLVIAVILYNLPEAR